MDEKCAWLIERDRSPTCAPEYVGMCPDKPGVHFWTMSPYRARRFRSFGQAKQFSDKVLGEVNAHRICEHVFE